MKRLFGSKKTTTRLAVIAGLTGIFLVFVLGLLAAIPALSPSTGAQMADWLRAVLGPRPVAALESGSLAIQDAFNQFVSTHNGGLKSISLAQVPTSEAPASSTAGTGIPVASVGGSKRQAGPVASTDAVSAPPQLGWKAFGLVVNGSPTMAETLLSPDPQRPYAGIALVRMDLRALQLHMVPGTQEPSHASSVVAALPNMGVIPAADRSVLAAAFNGGFKAVNGHYGMLVNGITLLPPQAGLATIAIYQDGHVAIGAWGQQINPSPDMLAFRQNCPPLIQDGSVNPQVDEDIRSIWGNTVGNSAITWRTAVGLTQDGRYLIYAVGNGTSVKTLADALLQAGAYNAMQLDINRPFARFVTYQAALGSTPSLNPVTLLPQMENESTLYLTPHQRDFFYLTLK